jgi:Golgi apyrase
VEDRLGEENGALTRACSGISTFGEHPHDVGPEHLDKLLSHALKKIPLADVPDTPLFLLATAGMRILPPLQH